MKGNSVLVLWILLAVLLSACSGSGDEDNGCRVTYEYDWQALIPGPGEEGYDADLAEVARIRDRQFHVFHTLPTGLNAEMSISRDKTYKRQALIEFLQPGGGWDFESATGFDITGMVDSWWKVAGAYGGVGVAADAFRYGVMRDQCYPAEEVQRAREQLLAGLEGLHTAVAITGGASIARGLANKNYPGAGKNEDLTPLFDGQGNPLPAEKDNGTWREDVSGLYPDYIWEDSCSRDMLIGWVVGFGAVWEVIENDDEIDQQVKDTMREDALAVLENLKTVRDNGYDLELLDADGRTTFHGYLNENNLDRIYIDGVQNGFHTIMALGVVAALADVADDPDMDRWLYDELIEEREFDVIARDNMLIINMEEVTNFSNYNMAFEGTWLALRHVTEDEDARANIRQALDVQLYDAPDKRFQPVEMEQTFFDLTWVAGMCDASSRWGCRHEVDEPALERALRTLEEFPPPPFFEFERTNCDEDELASGTCIAEDGQTELTVLGEVGRNGSLIVEQCLPMRLRGPSNYYWRSNPYKPNGGSDGPGVFAGPDFRFGYWMGRWTRK